MVVGVIAWELEIYGCQSLKDKRRVVKSLKDRLHNRFNVSAAETGHHDLWQRAQLAACVVSSERRQVDAVLEQADRFVNSEPRARVIDARRSFV